MENQGHHIDSLFMQRAFQLAALGRGKVSPNPLVGSVVVYDGAIIGEGWHKQYGKAHAEVNAIQSVVNQSLVSQSTVYVNLEPCSHFGKTPPCAEMLIKHNVKRVVIANLDSNPLVAGEGIKKLREANIDVTQGVLENEGRELNKRFFTLIEKQRPYIILKWAQTRDGFVARENFDSKWISNVYARQLVHQWRSEEDAILVGTRTTMHDNPKLNVRDWSGRDPIRIVIDRFLKLNDGLHVFDGSQKTICYNTSKNEESHNISWIKLAEEDFFNSLVKDLYRQKVQSIIIEGGTETLNFFIMNSLWDEARIFIGDKTFDKGILAPSLPGKLMREEIIIDNLLQWRCP